ncbi:MAG: protein kinase [Candidatus Brocadiae bacterium]|nr:protein kinase [Candidatus Brocadiia bacterium]
MSINDDRTTLDPLGGPQGGRIRLGPYETSEVLGRGGMAVVYKGMQQSLGRVVAIKVLPKEFSRDRQFVGRFHREAESVAKLNHPNIIQIIDKGEEAGICYFVMEYVKGMSLAARLANKGCTLKEMVDIALQVCSALHYAHENGVVHRDIKPANILIDEASGIAKVADFGIAQLAEKSTAIGTLTGDHMAMGTLDYMAPEQKRDAKNVDRRADVYSMGVVLYEMATGRVPMGLFDPPSRINREATKDLDVIIMKCLRDKPEERYQSCLELSNALIALPQNPSTMVRMISSVRSGVTNIGTQIGKRNPRYIAAFLFLVIGVGATAWAAVKYGKKKDDLPGPAGTGGGAGTGTGTGKPVDPVPPVDPRDPEGRRFDAGLAEVLMLKNAGDYAGALKRMDALEADFPGKKQDLALERARLEEKRIDALGEEIRQRLESLVEGADLGERRVRDALDALLKEARAAKVGADVLEDIREQVKRSQEMEAEATRVRLAEERKARYQEAIAEARSAADAGDWSRADAALEKAAGNATAGQQPEVEALAREMAARRTAASTEDEKRKAFRDAVSEAKAHLERGLLDQARTALAKAGELAGGDGDLQSTVAALRRDLDAAVKQDEFARKMKEAQAAEETTPESAAKMYRAAAAIAPTEAQAAEANRKAFGLEQKVASDAKEAEYRRHVTSARQARDAKLWAEAKTHATNALAAKPGDPAARAILDEAQAALTAAPPDPIDPTPRGKYALKFVAALPVTLHSGTAAALDAAGNALFLDAKLKRIQRFDADLKLMEPVLLTMAAPHRMAVDPAGRVWISDAKTCKIYRIDLKTGTSDLEALGKGAEPGQIYDLTSMARDRDGLLLVDYRFHRIQRIGSDGKAMAAFGREWDGRAPKEGHFLYAYGVAADDEGGVYVSDYKLKLIHRFRKDGTPDRVFKSMPDSLPTDLLWANGKLYVADQYLCRVVVLDREGLELGTYGTKGKTPETFGRPSSMVRMKSGKLLVVDTYDGSVSVLEEQE